MTLQPIPSEFLYIRGKFVFFCISVVTSFSSLIVFLLSMWQVEDVPKLAWGGGVLIIYSYSTAEIITLVIFNLEFLTLQGP
jgi:hypothetical protein